MRTLLTLTLALAPWGFQCDTYTQEYAAQVQQSRIAWAASAMPADVCAHPRVRLRELPVCPQGCGDGFYVAGTNTLLIRKGMSRRATESAVRHETLHWLAWCTGYQASGDAGHADPRLWGPGGVLARAESQP